MRTKLYYLLLLCLMVLGRGEVWADTETFNVQTLADKAAITNVINNGWTSGNISISFSKNTSGSGGNHFEGNESEAGSVKNIKWRLSDGNSTMTITSADGYLVKQVKLYLYEEQHGITTTPGSTLTSGTDGSIKTETYSISDNTQRVAMLKTGSTNHIFKIEVTYETDSRSTISTFAFNRNEVQIRKTDDSNIMYINNSVMNTGVSDPFEFIYDSSRPKLKMKVNITDNLSLSTLGASANSTYFTVTSSDNTVINVDGVAHSVTGENSQFRYYFDNLQVLKAGTTTLTFKFLGSSSYKPAESSIVVNVKELSQSFMQVGIPYTWNFATGDWANTKIQVGYQSSAWTTDANSARPTSNTLVPDWSGIEIIRWLDFTLPATDDLYLNWNEKKLWLDQGVVIKFPSLPVGKIIKIRGDKSDFSIEDGGTGTATASGNVFTITSEGTIKVKMNQETSIYSIYVGDPLVGSWTYTPYKTIISGDTKERAIRGTLTFTGEGTLAGGTEINDVPGITLKIGSSADSWEVVNIGTEQNPRYATYLGIAPDKRPDPTTGCFYEFTPIVNGYLSLNVKALNSHNYIYRDRNNSTGYSYDFNGVNGDYNVPIPLLAGHTYTLATSAVSIDLHSFTFTPAFLQSGKTPEEYFSLAGDAKVENFNARIGDPVASAFPKLIDPTSETQQNKVKFAGDKTKVYLYKNNDVDLLAAGDNILIRGTVLDKNNEDGLVAYYYLNSQIITLKSAELEDQAYISSGGLTDGKYTFTYNGNIVANGGTLTVKVKKDAGEEYDVTATVNSYDSSNDQTTIDIPFVSLEEGATYRVRIPTNTLQLSGSSTVKNSEVVRTFSVNKDGEAQVKMIYPTGIATVGTAIILETYINGTAKNVNDGHKVKGILSDGSSNLNLDATFSSSQIVFKPETTLKPNTTYTLTIPTEFGTEPNKVDNKIYLSTKYTTSPDVYYQVTHNKVFTFTTGSSSGTEPQVIPNGTYPAEGAVVPNGEYSGGTISFTFDQKVELEPYSTVTATPVNGSESTATGKTFAPEIAGSLTVGEDGKTVSFNYSEDELKYDLYYQVVIPANTVIGAGGLPNASDIILKFKMGTKASSISKISSSSFPGYPFTWDFTKLGVLTDTNTKLSEKATSTLKSTTRWLYDSSSSSHYYGNFSEGVDFPQGEVLSYNNGTEDVEIAETQGLRWSLTKRNASSVNHRLRIVTNPASLYVLGNTHYLTIPNVPVGKLYIKAKHSDILNVNSPNAVFVEGGMPDDNTKGATTTSSRVYILNVKEAGDVTFCLDDVYLEMIAVATDEKTFKSGFAESGKTYATDRLTYDVRYDLLNTLTNHKVKPYYVTGITDNAEDNTATINASEVKYDVAGADEGVILLYEGEVSSDTNVPIFKADVNTEDQSGQTNTLKVVPSGTTTVPTPEGDYYMYVLSNRGSKSEGVAFYRYTGSSFSDRAAYLEVPKYMVNPSISGGSARAFRMVFFDEDGSETTVVRAIEKDGITETVEQAGGYYDLRGLRLAKPDKRGLYIKDGKKIYVK